MTVPLLQLPRTLTVDANGTPRSNAKLYVFAAQTTNPVQVWQDQALTIPHPVPIRSNAEGTFPPIYADLSLGNIKINITDEEDVQIPGYPIDNIPAPFEFTQTSIVALLNPLTTAEAGAGVTPVNFAYPAQTAIRYANNGLPGTTDMAGGIQAAIDSASQSSAEVRITDENGLSKPLLLRTTTTQNISIAGNGRTSTLLSPNANDIRATPQNVNCLIFNQGVNNHLHLKSLRCWNGNAYTGVFVYATQGGGADATGHSLFSCSFDDLWLSFGGTAGGIFRGGFQNMKATRLDFESTKNACFLLEGVGNADQHYSNNVMFSCFDAFIDGNTDTLVKAVITVDGLHAYNHQRGPLISITKGVDMQFRRIVLEPAVGNAGTTGLFQFTDCTDVICDGFTAGIANAPTPKCAIGINLINGFTGKFSNGKIAGTVGIQVSGTGTLDLTVDNVDFIGCDTAFQMLSGTLGGAIYLRKCRLNNNQLYALITLTGTASFDLTVEECEILNCGLNGVATTRNMDLTTSGAVRLNRCKFGQNNAGAAAANYIRASGSGTFNVIEPIIIGAPPTALVDATSSQPVNFVYQGGSGGTLTAAATITLPGSGDVFQISGNTNITSVTALNCGGRTVKLIFQGTPTFTDGSNLKLAGNFVATADDTITIVSDGTSWYEVSRSIN